MSWIDLSQIGTDKLLHFSFYSIVSFIMGLFAVMIPPIRNGLLRLVTIGFSLSLVGIIEEYRQWFIPDRSTELLDAIANLAGTMTGMLIPLLIHLVIKLINLKSRRLGKSDLKIAPLLLAAALILAPSLYGLSMISEYPNKTVSSHISDRSTSQ